MTRQNSKQADSRLHSKKAAVAASVSKRPFFERLPKVSLYVILFVLLWVFSSFVYGDVFYISEQFSMFAFDETIMKSVLEQPFGYALCFCRFVLLSFRSPFCGGMLLALILTVATWLAAYVINSEKHSSWIAIVPSFIILFFLEKKGLNIYYQREPSLIFGIPLVYLLLVSIVAIAKRLYTKKHIRNLFLSKDFSGKAFAYQCGLLFILFTATTSYAFIFQQNTVLTARLQRQLQEKDTEGMIETALKARQPSRSVAAYYAIALSKANLITENLFDIPFQYPDEKITNVEGKEDVGTEIYVEDCNFYAGLINSAYHSAMERTVVDGVTVYRLKRMILCAIMNDEKALAKKYMHILSQVPFESSFIEAYNPMIDSHNLVKADEELNGLLELIPPVNDFEQNYKEPIFLGYNIALTRGNSTKALYNSLAACLYTKLMPNLIERTQPLAGGSLPSLVEEAVMINSIRNPDILKQFQISPMANERLQEFILDATKYKGVDKKEVASKLWKDFSGYYPLYFYYENIPEKLDAQENKNKEKKGGVN